MLTRHRREEGAVAIMVALLLVVFMAAVALTVDVGGLYLRRRALVNGSDSAALSAARTCAMPPNGTIAKGQTCTFWYDNDTLNGGNFAFLSLNPAGWDVPAGSNCSGSSSGGTSTLTKWINGSLPASVILNWKYPTYVCTDTGIRGVGGKNGPNSQVWSALDSLICQTRDFPINWEGCGTAPFTPCPPVSDAPSQGTIYKQGNIDKYDIIGFGSMTI